MNLMINHKKTALLRKSPLKKTSTRTSKKARELMEKIRLETKWQQLYKLKGKDKTQTYSMESEYKIKTPLLHPKLGWGFILKAKQKRIEVLFQSGIKVLVCKKTL